MGEPTRLRGSSKTKPSRRAVQRSTPKVIEQLGPAPALYYAIVVIVAVFVVLGLVMVLSATSANSVGGSDSPYATFSRQVMWAGLGLIGMLVALAVPYHRWRTLVVPGAVLACGVMMLPFVPGVGATINDATSWVRFGSFGFQPSEFLKLAAIAFLADYFARHQDELHEHRRGIVPLAIVAMGCCGASFVQGDLGSAIVLGAVILAVGVIAGVPLMHVGGVTVVGAAGALVAIMSDPRRFNRLTAFRDIEGNKEHLAWQSWQGLLGIANGGLTGSGIGGSRAKMGYLPLAHSDFIFAVVADEARIHRLVRRHRWVRPAGVVRHPDGARGSRHVRPRPRRWHLRVVRRAGDREHRRRRRDVAGHRTDPSVLLRRWHVAVRVDGVRRVAPQRGQTGGHRPAPAAAAAPAEPAGSAPRSMSDGGVFAVVTGGGTSGHVLPALAVAEGLVARGRVPAEIHYMGSRRGIETRLLPETPFPHSFLDVVGFQRSLSRRNLGFVPKLWRARRQAIRIVRELRPRVVVSVGGYASMPAVLAARALDVPVVVVSFDRIPGRASQVASRRCRGVRGGVSRFTAAACGDLDRRTRAPGSARRRPQH